MRLIKGVFEEETKKISQDTLFIWGQKDPALIKETPLTESSFITGKVTIRRLMTASHNLHLQQKENVWKEIAKFLNLESRENK